ncbi:PLEC [Mytilus coruscus]|uniref:PLEC n=1 Tax=Mytilus coruscus TaxID=42192 RepID=A0A6J8AC33_MYTCO|nr:PLEC [Mytilus coruscus]
MKDHYDPSAEEDLVESYPSLPPLKLRRNRHKKNGSKTGNKTGSRTGSRTDKGYSLQFSNDKPDTDITMTGQNEKDNQFKDQEQNNSITEGGTECETDTESYTYTSNEYFDKKGPMTNISNVDRQQRTKQKGDQKLHIKVNLKNSAENTLFQMELQVIVLMIYRKKGKVGTKVILVLKNSVKQP